MPLLAYCRGPGTLGPFILLLSACVGTTTQLAPLPPGAVKAEEEKQRVLALQENERQQARLNDIAYPILTMGTSLCPNDQGAHLGVRFATIHNYESEWQPAAARAFSLGDTLTVLSVTYGAPAAIAGLRPGDRIIRLDNASIKPGKESIKEFTALLDRAKKRGDKEAVVELDREGEQRRAIIRMNDICDYGSMVIQSGELNAFADGEMIYVTSTMMRFLSNDELRVVIGHEFAHNAMGHINAKKKNSLFGALLGALGDVFMASRGINTGGYYTSQGAKAGAMVFSQDFEREADYVGLYALTLADLSIEAAPSFWRQMAQADPNSIDFAHSHPTTAERFVRMEQAIGEIRQKLASNRTLLPTKKGESPLTEPPQPSLATKLPSIGGVLEPHNANAALPPNPLTQSTTRASTVASSKREAEIPGNAPSPVTYSSAASPSQESAARAPTQVQHSEESRSRPSGDLVVGRPRLKAALDDLIRLGMVTEYQEVRPGLLHLSIGNGFTQQSAVEFQLALLYEAYGEVSGGVATFELFQGDVKIGQYGKEGLSFN